MPGMIERYFSSNHAQMDDLGLHVERALIRQSMPLNTHELNEVFIIVSGTANHVLGDHAYPVKRGDVYAVKGTVPHGFADVCDLDVITLMYKPAFFAQAVPEIRAIPGFVPFFLLEPEARVSGAQSSVLTLGQQALRDIVALADIILREQEWGGQNAYPMLKMTFGALAGYIATQYDVHSQLSAGIPIISHAMAYMKQNLKNPLRLNDIAQSVSLSPRQLERLFLEYHDVSPMKVLRELRLRHALNMLSQTDCSVADAAHESGFEDVSYFIRAFRQTYGITPSAARKVIQEA